MKTTKCSIMARKDLCLTGAATGHVRETKSENSDEDYSSFPSSDGCKQRVCCECAFRCHGTMALQNSADKLKATIGTDIVNSNPDNGAFWLGPWTDVGVESRTRYSDGGVIQDRALITSRFITVSAQKAKALATISTKLHHRRGFRRWQRLEQFVSDGLQR